MLIIDAFTVRHLLTRPTLLAVVPVAILLTSPSPSAAQTLPAGPYSAFDGRVLVSADATATLGPSDDTAFFNFTDYEHSALRTFRLGASASWRPAAWLSLLGDMRLEGTEASAYGAYARIRPWRNRPFDVQVGRIPPAFGAYGRRTYAADNPFIGYPLGYQYLTSLRADAVPGTADDLLRMRARGWRASYPVGAPIADAGMPLVSAFRWDTGVQAHWGGERLDLAGAVTSGTLSHPRVRDNNGSKQLSGRLAVTPATGLILGVSGARGGWADGDLPGSSSAIQRSAGFDAEYSRDHWLVRTEVVHARWTLPIPLGAADAVAAVSSVVEGRYRLSPRMVFAARADRLGFSRISGSLFGGAATPWDAPVRRIELAGGYYFQRNLIGRVAIQSNWREAGRVRQRTYVATQLSYWF